MPKKTRDARGRWMDGNPGGPGRPPRATEAAYMRATLAVCDTDAWRDIVARAVKDARAGNARARDWLTRYTLGPNPPGPMALAVRDVLGVTDAREAAAEATLAPYVMTLAAAPVADAADADDDTPGG